MFQPVKKKKAYEMIVKQILDLIQMGKLPPGTLIPSERELALEFNVSRATIREAFRALESMGYTETKAGGGTFIKSFTIQSLVKPASVHLLQSDKQLVAEFVEVRLILETQGVKLAVSKMDMSSINTLYSILEEEQSDIESGGCGHKADEKFHIQLMRFTNNSALCTVFEACQNILSKSINLTMRIPDQPARALEGHRLIIKYIQEKNSTGAENAMEAHLRQIYDCMSQLGLTV